MTTPASSVLMFVVAAALGAAGQFLYRQAAASLSLGLKAFVWSPHLWAGVACYVAVMGLFVGAYRIGGSLAVLYPIYASTFVFGALIATQTEGTRIAPVNLAGMLLLVGGMALMGVGHKKGSTPTTHDEARSATGPSHPAGDVRALSSG